MHQRRDGDCNGTKGDAMNENRLEQFEKMLAAVQNEYSGILAKMEQMKADGKVKTVTYQQLMSRKMMYQNMLSLYGIYGLVEEEKGME